MCCKFDMILVNVQLEICSKSLTSSRIEDGEMVRRVACQYLHQIFLRLGSSATRLVQCIHYQGYDPRLIPMLVDLVPSMHLTIPLCKSSFPLQSPLALFATHRAFSASFIPGPHAPFSMIHTLGGRPFPNTRNCPQVLAPALVMIREYTGCILPMLVERCDVHDVHSSPWTLSIPFRSQWKNCCACQMKQHGHLQSSLCFT